MVAALPQTGMSSACRHQSENDRGQRELAGRRHAGPGDPSEALPRHAGGTPGGIAAPPTRARTPKPAAFLIVPVFGFANAGVSFAGVSASLFSEPLTMGVAAGLLLGKLIGAPGVVALLVRLGVANLSAMATWGQMTAQSLPA